MKSHPANNTIQAHRRHLMPFPGSLRRTVRWALLLALVAPWVATDAPARVWTDLQGRQLEADFVRAVDGRHFEVARKSDGKVILLRLSSVSSADQRFARYEATKVKLRKSGHVELSVDIIESSPDTVDQRLGWIDGTFSGISLETLRDMEKMSASHGYSFEMRDTAGLRFAYLYARGPEFLEILAGLERGDPIRVVGKVATLGSPMHWLVVDQIYRLPDDFIVESEDPVSVAGGDVPARPAS